jgi:hypothetical protein
VAFFDKYGWADLERAHPQIQYIVAARLAAERKGGAQDVWDSIARNCEANSVFWQEMQNPAFAQAFADEVRSGEQIERGEVKP